MFARLAIIAAAVALASAAQNKRNDDYAPAPEQDYAPTYQNDYKVRLLSLATSVMLYSCLSQRCVL